MRNKIYFIILIVFSLNVAVQAQEIEWLSKIKKIVPIQSTEKDVIKLLGQPIERNSVFATYETDFCHVDIEYSSGRCNPTFYNIEQGIVVGIDILIKDDVDIEFKKLNLNLDDFVKEHSDDTLTISYVSLKKGIDYGTYIVQDEEEDDDDEIDSIVIDFNGNEILTSIHIFPPQKYDYLKCKKSFLYASGTMLA